MTGKMSGKRYLLFRVSGITLALVIALSIGELALRWMGFVPWAADNRLNEPIMLESHPTYGWQSKEGIYQYSTLPDRPPIRITILPDGSRSSGTTVDAVLDDRPKIVLVGCSFMFGWALTDQDTLAWKLQDAFPDRRVVNFGTAGHGTYQSLLRVEDALPKLHPAVVVYGMIQPHLGRNVASGNWLYGLSIRSRRGHVSMPYVTLSRGRLKRHGLTQYSSWPGRKYSALITILEKSWAQAITYSRTRQAKETTRQVLLEMKKLADQHHAKFLIAFIGNNRIDPEFQASYRSFAEVNHIPYVDCSLPLDKSMTVPGDSHPNEKVNDHWFNLIEPAIRNLLAEKAVSIP